MSSFSKTPATFIKKIALRHFRNIEALELNFHPGVNLFIGNNGQGKTNMLEAIALACLLKPMQSLRNSDLIKEGCPQAFLRADFGGLDASGLELEIFPQGKKASLNGKNLLSAQKIREQHPLVSFIPCELSMISGSSALRRRALDQAAAALFSDHINASRAFDKALSHRNRLLKGWPLDHAVLESFTKLMIHEGARVIYYRLKALEAMKTHFSLQGAAILGPKEAPTIGYFSGEQAISYFSEGDLVHALEYAHQECAAQEKMRRVSLFGPHLDDMVFFLNDLNAQKSASRGQSRALVLAFKLAQMLAIFEIRGHPPIVILDDIVSELDREKKDNLVSLIATLGTQAFFSATDLECFGGHLSYDALFKVHDGGLLAH